MLLQAVTAAATSANDYLGSPSPLANMLTAAGVSAWTIKKLKEWNKVKWINDNTDKINRVVSVGFALATTVGLHFAFHDDVTGVHHGGILEVGLPSASEFLGATWRTLGSYMLQQGALRGFLTHEEGLKAADIVADTVKEKKEELAEVVLRKDDTVLKLREPEPKPRTADDVPIDWAWNKKKDVP